MILQKSRAEFFKGQKYFKKITDLIEVKNRNTLKQVLKGSLTDEILNKKPKSLIAIEKDNLSRKFKKKYFKNKIIKVYNNDVLKITLKNCKKIRW